MRPRSGNDDVDVEAGDATRLAGGGTGFGGGIIRRCSRAHSAESVFHSLFSGLGLAKERVYPNHLLVKNSPRYNASKTTKNSNIMNISLSTTTLYNTPEPRKQLI